MRAALLRCCCQQNRCAPSHPPTQSTSRTTKQTTFSTRTPPTGDDDDDTQPPPDAGGEPRHPSPNSLLLATTATGSPLIHSPAEPAAAGARLFGGLLTGDRGGDRHAAGRPQPPPVIFSPTEPAAADRPASDPAADRTAPDTGIDLSKEPASLSEAQFATGYGVGDPAAGAGGVATGITAGRALVSSVKVRRGGERKGQAAMIDAFLYAALCK